MRSDFWSLPYAAQQAIRRGEHEASKARRRAFTIQELHARIAELEAENAALKTNQHQGINHDR